MEEVCGMKKKCPEHKTINRWNGAMEVTIDFRYYVMWCIDCCQNLWLCVHSAIIFFYYESAWNGDKFCNWTEL